MTAHPYLSEPQIAIAHRGGALEVPENSLAGFQHAVDLGITYLETDCHLTADGYIVAIHDPDLDRSTDRTGRVSDLTYAEISQARILTPDGEPSDETIPLLEEVLLSFPRARCNIDAKHDAVVEPLIAMLRRMKVEQRVCLASFSASRLDRIRSALGAGGCTALTRREVALLRTMSTVGKVPGNRFAKGGVINRIAQVPMKIGRTDTTSIDLVDEKFVVAAHAAGVHVHVWVVDERADMERYYDRNVDGVMTDRPSVLVEVLNSRRSNRTATS